MYIAYVIFFSYLCRKNVYFTEKNVYFIKNILKIRFFYVPLQL